MDRVILKELKTGQAISIYTDEEKQGFRYTFTVKTVGELPVGLLVQTDPEGVIVGPSRAELLGSGRWTTPAQNPMQRADWFVGRLQQETALTIGWGVMYVGGCAIVRDPGEAENNFYELQPAITNIEIDELAN